MVPFFGRGIYSSCRIMRVKFKSQESTLQRVFLYVIRMNYLERSWSYQRVWSWCKLMYLKYTNTKSINHFVHRFGKFPYCAFMKRLCFSDFFSTPGRLSVHQFAHDCNLLVIMVLRNKKDMNWPLEEKR